jgi:hypothetical protein
MEPSEDPGPDVDQPGVVPEEHPGTIEGPEYLPHRPKQPGVYTPPGPWQ